MTRVLAPAGYVVTTADNRMRLDHWLDPRINPALAGARRAAKQVVPRSAASKVDTARPSADAESIRQHQLEAMLESVGLELLELRTLGHGPYTFMGRPLLPARVGARVHRTLQSFNDRGTPGLRAMGSQFMVLARRQRQ